MAVAKPELRPGILAWGSTYLIRLKEGIEEKKKEPTEEKRSHNPGTREFLDTNSNFRLVT